MLNTKAKELTQVRGNQWKTYKKEKQKCPDPALEPEGLEYLLVIFVSTMK
jgi:hypothetical protein